MAGGRGTEHGRGEPYGTMLTSVVVISKDEKELDATLEELSRQTGDLGHEILVVDASEGRLDWIAAKHPRVVWIDYRPPLDGKSSIPQQRNVGVRAAKGDIIAFCDSGGIPLEGWLENLTRPIAEGRHQYTCGPVTSRRPGVYRTINDVEDGAVVDGPPTANVAISRELFERVGGFDERYAYGSDVDLAWRCAKLGEAPRNVRGAVMTMDWGQWKLQKRRSWRYGRARARLGRLHKAQFRILRGQPEILAYPGVGVGAGAGMLLLMVSRKLGGMLLGAAGLSGMILLWRNRRQESRGAVMLGHFIYGWGYIAEILFGPRRGKQGVGVVHSPQDDGVYVENLVAALKSSGIRAYVHSGPTRSASANLLVHPIVLAIARMRGVRVWHLHWTWGYSLHWATGRVSRRVLRGWFKFNLGWARRLGIHIVWTAHNLYPHEPVFDDDRQAREDLIENASAVIVHNEAAGSRVRAEFDRSGEKLHEVDQGTIDVPGSGRAEARRRLGIPEESFVVLGFGKVMQYKGLDTMLAAGLHVKGDSSGRVQMRVVGECQDPVLRDELEQMAKGVRAAGVGVHLDLVRVSEERLGDELDAADACVFMFRQGLNSTSIRVAKARGRIAIVGDGAGAGGGAGELPGGAGAESCAASIQRLIEMSGRERAELEGAGRSSGRRTWEECAEDTVEVYRKVLGGGR